MNATVNAIANAVAATESEQLTRAVYDALNDLVGKVAGENNAAALSIIYQGVQIWAMELAAIDDKGAGDYLRALADLLDPPAAKIARKGRKAFADESERRRKAAVRAIYETVLRRIALAEKANKTGKLQEAL